MPPLGKITAQGRVEIFPKSSPFIKFAILPKKRPMGATQATISENLKKLVFVFLENPAFTKGFYVSKEFHFIFRNPQ